MKTRETENYMKFDLLNHLFIEQSDSNQIMEQLNKLLSHGRIGKNVVEEWAENYRKLISSNWCNREA